MSRRTNLINEVVVISNLKKWAIRKCHQMGTFSDPLHKEIYPLVALPNSTRTDRRNTVDSNNNLISNFRLHIRPSKTHIVMVKITTIICPISPTSNLCRYRTQTPSTRLASLAMDL